MLIHEPHDLGSIHCRTAAQSDDCIRLEGSHLLHAFLSALQCRVRSYIVEACVLDSHFVELLLDRLCISVLVKECICYDKCFLLVHYCAKLVQSYRHTAFLKVYLLRCSEPQHILSPLGNCLHIQKMFYSYVL